MYIIYLKGKYSLLSNHLLSQNIKPYDLNQRNGMYPHKKGSLEKENQLLSLKV